MPSTLPNWTTVGFVGDGSLEPREPVAAAIRALLDELQVAHGPLVAVTSIGSGANTLFVEEVARRELPYFLLLPQSEDQFRQSLSSEPEDRVAAYFENALSIDEIRGVDSLVEGYLECGVLAVNRSDIVLAVWNGEGAAGQRGISAIVEYARALERPLIWIDPSSGNTTRERLPLPPARPSTATGAVDPIVPSVETVMQLYADLDATAEQNAPTTRRLVVQVIWLHLIGAAVGFTGSALNLPGIVGKSFTLFKLAALSLALYLSTRQRRAHHRWKGARLAAEICRSFIAIWPMRRREARLVTLGADEHADLFRNLKTLWYLDRTAERPLDEARDRYVVGRVRDQLDYFERKYKNDGRRARRLKAVAYGATIVALILSGLVLGMSLSDMSGTPYDVTKWFSNIIGLVPPALLTLVLGLDLARRSERFGDATANLLRAERRLNLALTWPSLWREVGETEDLLMREVVEWYSQSRPRQTP